MSDEVVPLNHLVIIPDGNRRWAKKQGMNILDGYRKTSENVGYILQVCKERAIHYLTVWGFSTENWKRGAEEVNFLMSMFEKVLQGNYQKFIENKIRFHHLGRKDRIPAKLLALIQEVEEKTKEFTEWHFNLALDYGGKDEILHAVNAIVADVKSGKITSEIDEAAFREYLYTTNEIPDPDLILRTSGEQRLSGMMPFQTVYTELAFIPEKFPELDKDKLSVVIDDYYNRQRRFGAG